VHAHGLAVGGEADAQVQAGQLCGGALHARARVGRQRARLQGGRRVAGQPLEVAAQALGG
jgi:hypothetical protein